MTQPRLVVAVLLFALLGAATTTAQDQLVLQALKKIEAVEKKLPGLPAGDVAAANRLLGDLKWANKRLRAAYKKDTSHWQDAARRLKAADDAVRKQAAAGGAGGKPASGAGGGRGKGVVLGQQFEQLKQLDKEVRNGFANLKLLNKTFMGDAYRVGSTQQEIDKLKQRLAAFPPGDKNVKIVAGNLQQFEALFEKWKAEYAADSAAAGGLAQKLDAIKAKYASDAVPGPIYWPYEQEKLTAWAARSKQLLDALPADIAVIQQATNNSKLQKRAKNMLHWVARSIPERLRRQLAEVRQLCEGAVDDSLHTAKFLREIKPDDRHMIVNNLLTDGALESSMARLQKGMEAVDMAAALDLATARKDAPDRKAQRAQIERTIGRVRELAKSALKEVRMPKAVQLDAAEMQKLTAIATETLARKKYGVHEIERLVVTSKLKRKEKTEGTIRGSVVGATITSYHYVWDEYHVVTAEKVDGEVWVFHNLLKYYHQSDTITPQEVWILSRRFQGTQILPENVAK